MSDQEEKTETKKISKGTIAKQEYLRGLTYLHSKIDKEEKSKKTEDRIYRDYKIRNGIPLTESSDWENEKIYEKKYQKKHEAEEPDGINFEEFADVGQAFSYYEEQIKNRVEKFIEEYKEDLIKIAVKRALQDVPVYVSEKYEEYKKQLQEFYKQIYYNEKYTKRMSVNVCCNGRFLLSCSLKKFK